MPGGNKYTVQTTNRFMLAESASESGSEDETSNLDPFSMIQQATTAAIKKTKEDLKNAHKKPAVVKKSEPEEEKKDEKPKGNNRNRNNNNRGNREPRGNQQQRRGPRNERKPKDGAADGENNNQVGQKGGDAPLGDNNRQRRERRPRDRASGDPRTGVKAQEKRGGAGKGNWGKADKNYDEEKPEEVTPEEKPATTEGEEKPAASDAENEEPQEPAGPPPLSLEEYMASLGVTEAPKNLRKANDGVEIKGQHITQGYKDKIHKEKLVNYASAERTNNKNFIAAENLSFVSRGDRGGFFYTDNRRDGDRGNRRGGDRGGNRKGGDRQPKSFTLENNAEAFPSLGGKVSAK